MEKHNNETKKITNQDVDEMIAGIQENYLLREGLCGTDLREYDLTELDYEHFKLLCYDDNTKFSEEQIEKFQLTKLLELTSKPIKGIQELHTNGINGDGIRVAIIDTAIDKNKASSIYGNRIKYINSEFEGGIEPHGATVLDSFMRTLPNANVDYYPLNKSLNEKDKSEQLYKYIRRIVESEIKVISLSNSLSTIMKERTEEVLKYLKAKNVTLIDSDVFQKDFGFALRDIEIDGTEKYRESLCEPEDSFYEKMFKKFKAMYKQLLCDFNVKTIEELKVKLVEAGLDRILHRIRELEPMLEFEEFSAGKDSPLHILKQRDKSREREKNLHRVLIPCAGRTLNGKYWGTSSVSYTVPVVAGLFAICKQVYPKIEYDDFVKLCKDTSQIIDGCNLIQPQVLMERAREIYSQKRLSSDGQEL